MTDARVEAVHRSPEHGVGKEMMAAITLIAGHGVEGDAHAGATAQHLSRLANQAAEPNLRQVHLMHAELFDELAAAGFSVGPGQMGENVTTRGVDLLALPKGATVRLGEAAVVEITGLRNPCAQLNTIQPGLMQATLAKDDEGGLVRKTGVMGVVLSGGVVRAGDGLRVELPAEPRRPLEPV